MGREAAMTSGVGNYDDAAAARRYEDPDKLNPSRAPGRLRKPAAGSLSTHVPIRFTAVMVAAVKALADQDHVTVSTWVRNLVAREIERRQSPVTRGAATATVEYSGVRPTAETTATASRLELAA
jgi:hypothetical protein